ncbi:MAG: HAD-IA family hydrolase [Thaumarchaeota archaeon]|nr:HAD-IA family hydrolase [Nitrososphaerota archaeon]MDG6905344.1 HAD-IA family hydrolase [Nitrososphaerota archaeon]
MSSQNIVFLFDIGGVVIKWKSNDPIFSHIAKKYGVPFEQMRAALLDNFLELEAGKISADKWISLALSKFGKEMSPTDDGNKLLLDPFVSRAKLRKGAIKLIDNLRRNSFRVFALTNTSQVHLVYMKGAGWLDYFDGFYASCQLHCNKPDSGVYNKVIKSMRTRADLVVFIDDKAENVIGARKAGIRHVIRFKTLEQLDNEIKRIIHRHEVAMPEPSFHK